MFTKTHLFIVNLITLNFDCLVRSEAIGTLKYGCNAKVMNKLTI